MIFNELLLNFGTGNLHPMRPNLALMPICAVNTKRVLSCCYAICARLGHTALAFLQSPCHNLRQRRSVPRPQHPPPQRLTCGSQLGRAFGTPVNLYVRPHFGFWLFTALGFGDATRLAHSTPSYSGDATRLLACCFAICARHGHTALAVLHSPGHKLRQRRSVPRPQHPAPQRLTCGSTRTCLRHAG